MKQVILVVICLFTIPGFIFSKTKLDSLLIELDNAIKQENLYTDKKAEYISTIKQQLSKANLNDEDKYLIYKNLTKEYEVFICDSANLYANKSLDIATKINNTNWIQESKIQLARIKARAGIFISAINILDSINKNELSEQQVIDYYSVYSEAYIYWIEFQDGFDIDELVEKRGNYQDSILQVLVPGTYAYAINYGTRYIEIKDFKNAERVLITNFPHIEPHSRDYAVYMSILAYLYEGKKDTTKQKEYLAISAISDIKAAVKENISLRTLALYLYNDGDLGRANYYIKKSMEDANFYNARLRNIQTAKILPIIDKAYQLDREKQQNKLSKLLTTVSILSLILIIAIYFVIRQMQKVAKAREEILQINSRLNLLNDELKLANEHQLQTNVSLTEANHIKEQFISSFLEICTEYIDKLNAFKITVNRKIKAGQTADILKITSSTEDSAKELKELYTNFDKAFLNIYPNFVAQFNKLLRTEEFYPEINGKSLNHELRVFALIKLGITDNNKIATFLHYSLRTIYNYRSKVKSKAIDQEEDFEEKVRKIS